MLDPARPLVRPTPSQAPDPDPADIIPLRGPVQPALLPEPSYVRIARPSALARGGSSDDLDLIDDREIDHHHRSDQERSDGRPRLGAQGLAHLRVRRWLVSHLHYDEARAGALLDEHGARKVLDAIYDHVVEWHVYSRPRDGVEQGLHRLRGTDQWGRPLRNHAAYLTWQMRQG